MPDLQEVPTNVERIQTDAGRAVALRDQLAGPLQQVCAGMDEARRMGLKVGFNITQDSFGRHRVNEIEIVKAL